MHQLVSLPPPLDRDCVENATGRLVVINCPRLAESTCGRPSRDVKRGGDFGQHGDVAADDMVADQLARPRSFQYICGRPNIMDGTNTPRRRPGTG